MSSETTVKTDEFKLKKTMANKKGDIVLVMFNWEKDLEYFKELHKKAQSTTFDDYDNFMDRDEDFNRLIFSKISSGNSLIYMIWTYFNGKPKRAGLVYLTDMIQNINATLHPVMDRHAYRDMLKLGIKRNIMMEGSKMLIDYAFNEIKFQRLTGSYLKINKGAVKMCEKLGFQHEGLIRKASRINGSPEDMVILGLLPEELIN